MKIISKKHSCLLSFLFFISLLFYSCGGSPSNDVQSFSPEIVAEFEEIIDENMVQYNSPAVIAGVWVPSQGTWIKAKGYADITTGRKVERDDYVRIGSITKTFTITVLLQLVDEGKIHLNDTLNIYFPGVQKLANITVRELANMTSGLFNVDDDPNFLETFLANPFKKWTPQEILNISLGHDPVFEPGTGYHYSNVNTIIVGMIIEKVTGNKIEKEIENRIITPLNLSHTSFPTDYQIPDEHMCGYWDPNKDGDLQDMTFFDPSIAWTAGAMISTLDDLHVWAEVLAEGELLKPETQQERLTWNGYGDIPYEKYCLGIAYMGPFLGHTGGIQGYVSVMFYLPEKKATIILFSQNDPDCLFEIFTGITRILFPDDVPW